MSPGALHCSCYQAFGQHQDWFNNNWVDTVDPPCYFEIFVYVRITFLFVILASYPRQIHVYKMAKKCFKSWLYSFEIDTKIFPSYSKTLLNNKSMKVRLDYQ